LGGGIKLNILNSSATCTQEEIKLKYTEQKRLTAKVFEMRKVRVSC
jgi:hypothetical protein